MKVRTRLFLFLLPPLLASIALISLLFAYTSRAEIVSRYEMRLKTALLSLSTLLEIDATPERLSHLERELSLSHLTLSFTPSPLPPLEISPIYEKEQTQWMSGYAPLLSPQGEVQGFLRADLDVGEIDEKVKERLFWILLTASSTLLLVLASLYLIADKISRPIQKLNNSALALAAGRYGESIDVEGPKEIAELANTLNTMSECLHENINRLKENSLLREKMYGEYECAMLLQQLMLEKNLQNCKSDAIAVQSITLFSENPRGFLLDFPKTETPHETFQIELAEADEVGFEGMYELLTHYRLSRKGAEPHYPYTSLLYKRKESRLEMKGTILPLFWSLSKRRFLPDPSGGDPIELEAGDLFFLYNRGLLALFPPESPRESLAELLSKVLKIFACEGIETTRSMLQKELLYATKRRRLTEDLHLLCFQVLRD